MGTIREWICALKYKKKKEKIWGNLEKVGFRVFVGKMGNGGGGGELGPMVGGSGVERLAVVCKGWGK
jgi:hypothetical protein